MDLIAQDLGPATEAVRSWLQALAAAIEVRQNTISLDTSALPARAAAPAVDDRALKLMERSLQDLPVPMQTLLTALLELKLDMARALVRSALDAVAHTLANLDSAVSFAQTAMVRTSDELREMHLEAMKDVSGLCANLVALVPTLDTSRPDTWYASLADALRAAQADLQQAIMRRAHRRPALQQAQVASSGVAMAHEAVKASEAVRHRLRALAEGPLTSLFEPGTQTARPAVTEEPAAAPIPETRGDDVDESALTERIQSLKQALRSLRRAIDGALADRAALEDDTLEALAAGLKHAAKSLAQPVRPAGQLPSDMQQADTLIQKEIRFLLGTLTVDRASLDAYLRFIKARHNSVLEAAAYETSAGVRISLAAWRMQLTEAFSQLQPPSLRQKAVP